MPTLEELLAAGMEGTGAAPARKPLGVPVGGVSVMRPPTTGYHFDPSTMGEDGAPVAYTTPARQEQLPPRYFDGDEFQPAGLPPDKIAQLQRQMVDAGLLKQTGFRLGVWDQQTTAAYADLLAYANSTGVDQATALQRYTAGAEQGSAERKPSAFVARLSRPEDIRSVAEEVAVRTIGRKMNAAESATFVESFTQAQRRAQEDYYQATLAADNGGAPATTYEAPDVQMAAERSIKESAPGEAQAYDAIGRYNQFVALLRGNS